MLQLNQVDGSLQPSQLNHFLQCHYAAYHSFFYPVKSVSNKRLTTAYNKLDDSNIFLGFSPMDQGISGLVERKFGCPYGLLSKPLRHMNLRSYLSNYQLFKPGNPIFNSDNTKTAMLTFIRHLSMGENNNIVVSYWETDFLGVPRETLRALDGARRRGKIDSLFS